ncbi:hypothetical protein ACFVZH_07995 [Streptomyces sp. NPDC059534]|uniref:hypothetical protein n=1 Tax=Streptomyces sp. NPDC059534 TaxID=3346859 RepID=UPI0036B4D06B
MTYDEIAEMYGVTRGAVYLQLRDSKQTSKRPDHSKYIPWTVKAGHAQARPNAMLRLFSRREQGETLPEVKERMLDKWLAEIKEADVVVCYNREQVPNPASNTGGWYYSKRRPSDGTNLIRVDPDADSEPVIKTPNPQGSKSV